MLSEILKRLGHNERSHRTYDEYLRIKEQMLGSKQIQRLDELRFLSDIRKSEEQVARVAENRRRRNLIIFFLLALTLHGRSPAVGVLLEKRETQEDIRISLPAVPDQSAVEERERNLRKQLQQQLENSRQEQDEVQANQSPDTPQQSESESDTQRTSAKYQSSRLGEEEKQRILAKLQDLCDPCEVVCSADCSVSRMAEMAGCHHKYLS